MLEAQVRCLELIQVEGLSDSCGLMGKCQYQAHEACLSLGLHQRAAYFLREAFSNFLRVEGSTAETCAMRDLLSELEHPTS